MSFLELDGNRHAIPAGESMIGSAPDGFLTLQGPGVAEQHLSLWAAPDGLVSVRRVSEDAQVFINGVLLGPQPAPLLHGDKIEVGGREFSFVDERRSGSTAFVSAADIQRLVEAKPAAKRKATAGTGGRLVSLTDGREYTIETGSLVMGREASCDVVIAHKRVSRRHAEIVATPKGYVVIDMSSNGVFVNGERISGQRLLARADVLRLGDDEFRFYADKATESEPPPGAPPPGPAPGAEYRLGDTLHGLPSTASPPPTSPPQPQAPATTPPAPPVATPPAPYIPAPGPPPASPPQPQPPATAPPVITPPAPEVQEPAPPALSPPAPPDHAPPAAEPQAPSPPAMSPPDPPAQAPPAAEPQAPSPPAAVPPAPPVAAPPTPPQAPPAPTAAPPAPAGQAAETLANLIVRSGELKGQRFPIRVPVVNIGRAEYNDIVVPDPSVSSAHAKIQLREGIWMLADIGSTNGSFVDGERVEDEAPLAPGAIIRFGDLSVIFEPTKDDSAKIGGGTQVLGSVKLPPQQEA